MSRFSVFGTSNRMGAKSIFSLLALHLNLLFLLAKAERVVDPSKTLVWGPGLRLGRTRLPSEYFFIHAVDSNGNRFTEPPPLPFAVSFEGLATAGKCRRLLEVIDRGDGSFIVRYKVLEVCSNVILSIKYNGTHVAKSPYKSEAPVYSERCNCPTLEPDDFMSTYNCLPEESYGQIVKDLVPFDQVNFTAIRDGVLKKYDMPGSVSLCQYVVKDNKVYRKCHGNYTGFKMFMDATLLALTRLVTLPDLEFFLNLGDWPLSKKKRGAQMIEPDPIISWCGSRDTYDIVLPTYDLTESSLENMGRVSLDMLSVQKMNYAWDEKENKGFWRGRDSRRERLKMVDIARKYPQLFNASITNFFFFRDEEEKYGPRVPHISFLEFFKYKYQINIDGTIAAYRFPYLLGGNSVVFKQNSPFYEFFYGTLVPYKHYIPIKRDLSDLVDKILWAKKNDGIVRDIANEARQYVNQNLLPHHVICYHVKLFREWSKRIVSPIEVLPDMERLPQKYDCSCSDNSLPLEKDEL